MANYPHSTNVFSSFPDLSQSDLLGEHTIRRSVVRIAKDQRKLLDSRESWAHEFYRQQQRFNVPPEVLRDLKAFHSRKLKAGKSTKTLDSPEERNDVDPDNREGDSLGSIPATPRTGDNNQGDQDSGDDEEEVETTISWSQSPEDRHRPQHQEVEQEEFLTQLPLKFSMPSSSVPVLSKEAAFSDLPSSSLGPEDELELEVPTALDVNAAPVNQVARQVIQPMLATPPSAQIVPCTYEQQEFSSTKEDGMVQNQKRPIYKRLPALYRSPKNIATTSSGSAMPRLSKPTLTGTQSSTSTSTTNTSSSIIPATHRDIPHDVERPTPKSSLNPIDSASSPVPQRIEEPEINTSSLENPRSLPPRQESPKYTLPPSPKHHSSPASSMPAPLPDPQPIAQPEAPFIEFTLKYPDYVGSIGDFVRACMYLQTLAGKRRLRPYLFDDFIRAWSEGYLPYVRECDGSGAPTKALTAIEWFNQIDDPPIYTKQVVTRTDLERILEFYPEEALAVQGIFRASQKGTPEDEVSKGKSIAQETQPPIVGSRSSPKSSVPAVHRASQRATAADIVEKEPSEADLRVAAPVRRPAPPSRALPPNNPISELPKRSGAGTGLTRSLSETTSHKRKPSDGFQIPAPKKASASFTSRPESSSGGSAVPSSITGGRRRFADDPEKRKRHFANFIRKRKENRDRIASSAPVNNTPTSGQRPQ